MERARGTSPHSGQSKGENRFPVSTPPPLNGVLKNGLSSSTMGIEPAKIIDACRRQTPFEVLGIATPRDLTQFQNKRAALEARRSRASNVSPPDPKAGSQPPPSPTPQASSPARRPGRPSNRPSSANHASDAAATTRAPSPLIRPRARAVVALQACGVLDNEIFNLRRSDLNLRMGELRRDDGRTLTLTSAARDALKQWVVAVEREGLSVERWGATLDGYLFFRKNGGKIGRST